ncbi:tyrosine--tRNA ligase [Candidatus Woesebacteria bacterium]|nr:tyrosine--tRNA ligase [Candidatus Woesebacteria bacterium]
MNTDLLTRRVAKILPGREALEALIKSKKKIRLYQGFDPTFNQLHLGHTIGFRKLMDFARAGHEVIFLFGTGTVLAGDPSERDSGRKLITQAEIDENIKTWKEQVSKIVDFDLVTIKQNGDWLTELKLKDIINIASNISATQLFKREMFTRRIAKGDVVWYHETLYPLLQGYDSVAMDVDLEIGGTDQEFNMLVGRELQKKMNGRDKFVLTTPMINGTDGKQMSKSVGNCIWLTDKPEDIYSKIMAMADSMITTYFELLTDIPMEEIKELDPNNPIENKKRLAYDITRQLHGTTGADFAQKYFESYVQTKSAPDDTPILNVKSDTSILEVLKAASLGVSNGDIKRTIEQGGVELEGIKITDPTTPITNGGILKFGKKTYRKIVV